MRLQDSIAAMANFEVFLRDKDGRVVPESIRRAHNVFTTTGRNWLSKLCGWRTLGSPDEPYTNRRVRWMAVGTGSQPEVTSVTSLQTPTLFLGSDYLAPISSVSFPTSTSIRFTRVFGLTEVSISGPVVLTEAGLYVDVNPYNFVTGGEGFEDTVAPVGTSVLNPEIGTNPPAAYKNFDPITKTQDFTLELRWDLRF